MRKRNSSTGRGKALDLWQAPMAAGEPLLCLATTFTFDATFFETECLGRFLQMDSHPHESDAVGYLIEREEKLAGARVAVLVDRRHAREKESLRWDILPVVVPNAVQHAKLAILCWAEHVRVLIGSANLTENAYRKNVEVMGSLELSLQHGGPREHVLAAADFLGHLLDETPGDETRSGPKQRVRQALNSLRKHIRDWPSVKLSSTLPVPIFGGIGPSVFAQLAELWPASGSPRCAHILSPFFDRDNGSEETIAALLDILAKRGTREVYFYIPWESLPDGRIQVFAPRALIEAARSAGADVFVHKVKPLQENEPRPLHAKILILANDDWELWLLGSSNFTRAGFGVGSPANRESNLVYRARDGSPEYRLLNALWPEIEKEAVDLDSNAVIWQPMREEEGEGGAEAVLPAAFQEALFDAGRQPPCLILSLGEGLPQRWSILSEDRRVLLDSEHWSGGAGEFRRQWPDSPPFVLNVQQASGGGEPSGGEWPDSPPFVLNVQWQSQTDANSAAWPVNVVAPAALPPPEKLRNLKLEDFIEILSSTRPLHESVLRMLKRRSQQRKNGDVVLDPHKRVNTETFLLRRTHRFAVMLERLRERLERPVLSVEALEWRLNGPVGARTIADAIRRDAPHLDEACFFLAELALTLKRVRASEAARGGLEEKTIRVHLRKCIQQIEDMASALLSGDDSATRVRHPKVRATAERVVQLWSQGEKVLVFCHYRATGRALRQHVSTLLQDEIIRLGSIYLAADEVASELERIAKRFSDRESPLHKHVTEALQQFVGPFAELTEEERHRIVEIIRRFLRTPSFLVRYLDLTRTDRAEAYIEAIHRPAVDGLSLHHRIDIFCRFLAERCTSEEREKYLNALYSLKTGNQAGWDIAEDPDPSEGVGDARRTRLLPNVRLANGEVHPETRHRLLLAFNTPLFPEILIASSVLAEGVDLHLNCRHVIHHDLCWNPSTLEQRTGRVDRLGSLAERVGQSIPVYLPYVAATQDEKMYRVVCDRQRWFQIVLGEKYELDETATDRRAERVPLPQSVQRGLVLHLEM
jgi:hypothetical protein